jgi:hypothetical protein
VPRVQSAFCHSKNLTPGWPARQGPGRSPRGRRTLAGRIEKLQRRRRDNLGTADLTIAGIAFTGTDAGDFNVTREGRTSTPIRNRMRMSGLSTDCHWATKKVQIL